MRAKRVLERERVKDGLRGWLNGRRKEESQKREKELYERSVKGLARIFAGRAKTAEKEGLKRTSTPERDSSWGIGAVAGGKRKRGEPLMADVSGLRRFWEGVARGSAESTCAFPVGI